MNADIKDFEEDYQLDNSKIIKTKVKNKKEVFVFKVELNKAEMNKFLKSVGRKMSNNLSKGILNFDLEKFVKSKLIKD